MAIATMLEILNAAIAVTAAAHNPSILHPSFLVAQRIVPEDWTLGDAPICTPALAIVKFAKGIVITVEPQKLQVIDNSPSDDARESDLPGIIDRYTQALPHVRYSGVGINFSGFVASPTADAILLRFLADGILHGEEAPKSVGVRLVFPVHDTQLRLAIDSGTVQNAASAEARSGIVIAANYHAEVASANALDEIRRATARFADCSAHFRETVNRILPLRSVHAAN